MKTNTPVVSPQDTLVYLSRALELLSSPRYDKHQQVISSNSWVRNTLAIDANSNHVSPKSDLAVAYCVLGAVQAVTPDDQSAVYVNSIIDMANPNTISIGSIPGVNDTSPDFNRVIRMFQKAMSLVERKWL